MPLLVDDLFRQHDVADMQRVGQGAGEPGANKQLRLIRHAFELWLREQPIKNAGDVRFADAGLQYEHAQPGGPAETRPAR